MVSYERAIKIIQPAHLAGSSYLILTAPNSKIRNRNIKQRQIFNFIYNWAAFHAVMKVFLYQSGHLVKPRVLLLVSTGVAAINSNDNVVHFGSHTPYQGKSLPLNDANKA